MRFAKLSSVKAVAEVYTPVAGEVVEVNEAIEDAAETINEDPYDGGWLCKIRVSGPLLLTHCLMRKRIRRRSPTRN